MKSDQGLISILSAAVAGLGLLGLLACAGFAAGADPPAASAVAASADAGTAVSCLDRAALDLRRLLAPPPADGSSAARAELDELLRLQATRTPAQVEEAQGDAALSIARFAEALGSRTSLTVTSAPKTMALVHDAAEAELAVVDPGKDWFARTRPYAVEPRLHPVVALPKSASYPSGHSAWAYTVGLVLADMVPERRDRILMRAAEFARNRSVAGVHYPSDVLAGEIAGTAIAASLFGCRSFQLEEAAAVPELRKAIGLPPERPHAAMR